MGRKSKSYKRRRRETTNPVGTKLNVAWWHGSSVRANEQQAEIAKLLSEERKPLAQWELERLHSVPWGEASTSTPLADLQAFADRMRSLSIPWEDSK